jgi:regulator of PEP synthase PpsR (kinase-PPPase family)
MLDRRTVFFISDRTGITAEMLGNSLMTQFEGVEFQRVTIPFIDTLEKAQEAAQRIRDAAATEKHRPIVFSTLIKDDVRSVLKLECAEVLDFFKTFIGPLEQQFGVKSSHTIGRSHGIDNTQEYNARIEAVNYTLGHDDGVAPRDMADADIILVGVSRSGKTPTCLYMAMQFGLKAANYPLTPEDFGSPKLPAPLQAYRHKIFGLTISPERLKEIRNERRPDSKYASIENCRFELGEAEAIMRHEGVPYLDATSKSIEELATTILHKAKLTRRVF